MFTVAPERPLEFLVKVRKMVIPGTWLAVFGPSAHTVWVLLWILQEQLTSSPLGTPPDSQHRGSQGHLCPAASPAALHDSTDCTMAAPWSASPGRSYFSNGGTTNILLIFCLVYISTP